MTVVIKDAFARANGPLLNSSPEEEYVSGFPTWKIRYSGAPSINISDNKIVVASDNINRSVAYIETNSPDGHVSARVRTSATGTHRCGIAFRYQDDDNHYLARINQSGGNNVLLVQKIIGGSYSALASGITVAGDADTEVEIKVVLDGNNITVFVDDVEEWSGSDATLNAATKHGIYLEGTTVYADDFLITDDGTEAPPVEFTASIWAGNPKIGRVLASQTGGGSTPTPTPPQSTEYALGFNMNDPRYFQSVLPYKNIASHPSFFKANGSAATFSANGYPATGNTSLRINLWGGRKCATGTYEITHSGSGSGNGQTFVVNEGDDFIILNFTGEVGEDLDIRLQGSVGTYTPTFAERANAARCVRFMDALWTNVGSGSYDGNNPTVRTLTGANNEFRHIVMSADQIADMALEFEFDPWVCMYYLASAAEITAFAQAMSAKLSGTGRKVYVEYANEAWNGQFPVTNWIDNQVGTAGRSGFYADKSDWCAELFKAEFLAGEVVGVMASQLDGTGLFNGMVNGAERALDYIDAVSPASYIGGPWARNTPASVIATMSDAQIYSDLIDDLNSRIKPKLQTWLANAQSRGWRMITYEAGTHLEVLNPNQDEAAQNRLYAFNNSESSGALYDQWLDWYEDSIGDLNVLYMDVSTGGGKTWGHKEYELDPNTPRWQSVYDRMIATAS